MAVADPATSIFIPSRLACRADDDVVVNRYPERGRDIDDGAGHVDVRLRRHRIAGWRAEPIGDDHLIGEARRGETASHPTEFGSGAWLKCTFRRELNLTYLSAYVRY
jgi:hypothetical protein